jgi:hypothetical protein
VRVRRSSIIAGTVLGAVLSVTLMSEAAQASGRGGPGIWARSVLRPVASAALRRTRSTLIGPVAPTATIIGPVAAPSTLATSWTDGATHDGWHGDFTGFGTMTRDLAGDVHLAPAASTNPGETHASLLTSVASYGDLEVTTDVTTVGQLRTGSAPNAWEVAWLLWHHSDNTHFYYVALKPNGFELGKEDPAYPGAQRFLVTDTAGYAVGSTHRVRVNQVGAHLTVWVDDVLKADVTDDERPYVAGHVGLYDEDSAVSFTTPAVTAAA